MRPNILLLYFFLFLFIAGCDAHLAVRRDLPLVKPISETCLETVIRKELPNGKVESKIYNGSKFWRVSSDRCRFSIEQEDRLDNDGNSGKLLIFNHSVVVDGFSRIGRNKEISEAEGCIEQVKPIVEKECASTVK